MDEVKNNLERRVKTTVKDSVFRNLFKESKYTLQLYNALHPEDTDVSEADISNVTIENILLDQLYNDCAFVVKNKLLVMVECQSTWSDNIIIRLLLYLAETWHQHIVETKQNRYGSKKLSLSEPEFYLVFVGEREKHPEWISLSKEFFNGNKTFIEMNVRIIYGEGDDIVSQFVNFTKVYNEQVKMQGRTEKAIRETIKICKDKNLLREYLEEREKEVMSIMMSLFDNETILSAYEAEIMEKGMEKGREQGIEEGMERGREQGMEEGMERGMERGKKEAVINLYDMGMSTDKIAKAVSVSEEKVKLWLCEPIVRS